MGIRISSTAPTVSFLNPVSFAGTLSGIFGTIGNILAGIGIRSGTVHPNSTEANAIANPFADAVWAAVQSTYPADKLNAIGNEYKTLMLSLLTNVNRWRNQETFAPRSVPLQQITDYTPSTDTRRLIRDTSFFYGVWAARNSDAQRPDDFVQVVREDMTNTIVPAIEKVTGQRVTTIPGTAPPGEQPGVSGTSGLASTESLLLFAGVGIMLFSVFKRK